MLTRTKVSIYTFIAVVVTVVGIGACTVPYLLSQAEHEYETLQVDVNERQARSMSNFLQSRLKAGVSQDQVRDEFQAAIEGTRNDRGYLCMVDQTTGTYLCHPRRNVIGTLAGKGATFASLGGKSAENTSQEAKVRAFDEILKAPVDMGGILTIPSTPEALAGGWGKAPEIVYSVSVPKTAWTVSSHENIGRLQEELDGYKKQILLWASIMGVVFAVPATLAARTVSGRYERQIEDKNTLLAAEQARSERLLLNVLPEVIASRMKDQSGMIADYYDGLTVMFCDIVGFTELSGKVSPTELVSMLNTVFLEFDRLTNARGLEKIKTIGDCYMVVGGAPKPRADHAEAVAGLALDLLEAVGRMNLKHRFNVRIGIDTGNAVAGVIGSSKFAYDLWGDTVNTASRMESHGRPGKIQCTLGVARALDSKFRFESCGVIEVKGKGQMETFFLIGRK